MGLKGDNELWHLVKHSLTPFKPYILNIQVSDWGDSIHVKLICYWCNWLLSLILTNLSNDDGFSESKQLARKSR